ESFFELLGLTGSLRNGFGQLTADVCLTSDNCGCLRLDRRGEILRLCGVHVTNLRGVYCEDQTHASPASRRACIYRFAMKNFYAEVGNSSFLDLSMAKLTSFHPGRVTSSVVNTGSFA